MAKKYRLKAEAVPFFSDSISTHICDLIDWKKYNVDEKALEEVEPAYISFGIKEQEDSSLTHCSGWSDGKGSRLHFTINFPSTKFKEHDEFSKGKIVRDLMNRFQRVSDQFFEDFVTEK
jgi:hypothetical protein